MIPVALDSNVLIYLAGIGRIEADRQKIEAISVLLGALSGKARLVAATQALGETYVVMQRMGIPREEARRDLLNLSARLEVAAASEDVFNRAFDLSTEHKLQFWDSLILSTAADAGCGLLLSEDMQHGFAWGGVTIVDPFAQTPHPKLLRALA